MDVLRRRCRLMPMILKMRRRQDDAPQFIDADDDDVLIYALEPIRMAPLFRCRARH